MKMKMIITKNVLVAGAVLLMAPPVFAKHGGNGGGGGKKAGPDVLHFSIKESFTNDSASSGASETSATGTLTANQAEQGSANKETLNLMLKGLSPSTTYDLFAITSDNPTSTQVDSFTTDSKGNASVHYSNSAKGKKNVALPAGIDPVSHILELDVVNDGTQQTVLTADLTNPSSIKYLVNRDISADPVTSRLMINSSKSKTSFKLTASGLNPSTDYNLVINGTDSTVVTSDANGNLTVTSAPLPANILDLNSVALTDSSNTTVVSTTLP